MELQIQLVRDMVAEMLQMQRDSNSDSVEDRKGVGKLRKEVHALAEEVKHLSERFPINIDRAVAYSAKEGVIDGFREIVKPNPEKGLKKLTSSIRRLLKGVKNNG